MPRLAGEAGRCENAAPDIGRGVNNGYAGCVTFSRQHPSMIAVRPGAIHISGYAARKAASERR